MVSIIKLITESLLAKRSGVWITLIAGTQTFQTSIGKKAVWFSDDLLPAEGLRLTKYLAEDFFAGLVVDERLALFTQQLDGLCQKTIQTKSFQRQKIQVAEEWAELILEPLLPEPRLLIFGCGYVGQELAQMAQRLDLTTTVVDDRPVFAHLENFPLGVQVICDQFSRAIKQLKPGANDFVVIVTRGHTYDRNCLEELAGDDLKYIGLIGSKRRVLTLKAELVKAGVNPRWLAKLHAPIGLEIGAETPAEIAVSILAEIIQVWRKGDLDESRFT